MKYNSLDEMLGTRKSRAGKKAPLAVVFSEDGVAIDDTLSHLKTIGCGEILLIEAQESEISADLATDTHTVSLLFRNRMEVAAILNRIIEKYPQRWIYWGYNAEFPYFPFCETRTISDVTTFMEEERRNAVFTHIVDLYSDDLERDQNAVSREHAFFDASGYYGAPRYEGPDKLERQFEVVGGLKWRFEEHIPWRQRRMDRISLFKAARGLEIDERGLFNEVEYNTISCPWHSNLTMAIASFRTAKALMHNPESRMMVSDFMAPQSQQFDWTSHQLLEMGFMEPGQWF